MKRIKKWFQKLFRKLGWKRYKTAYDILINIPYLEYKEPSYEVNMEYDQIFSYLYSVYEQIVFDRQFGVISELLYKQRMDALKKELKRYRKDYISMLGLRIS